MINNNTKKYRGGLGGSAPPSPGKPFKKSPSLITWRLIETKMPWGVLFLLGGGFTLAKCLQTSGLSIMLVAQLNK